MGDNTPKVLTATEFPAKEWAGYSKSQKLDWLDKQPVPGDEKVSLGTAYRNGEVLNASLHVVAGVLENLSARYAKKPADDKGRRALSALIKAFNILIRTFGNAQYVDYSKLLTDGKLGQNLPQMKTGEFTAITEGAEPESIVSILTNSLSILLAKSPQLGQVKVALGTASYSDVIQAVIAAGNTFVNVFNGGEASGGTADGDVPIEDDGTLPDVLGLPMLAYL